MLAPLRAKTAAYSGTLRDDKDVLAVVVVEVLLGDEDDSVDSILYYRFLFFLKSLAVVYWQLILDSSLCDKTVLAYIFLFFCVLSIIEIEEVWLFPNARRKKSVFHWLHQPLYCTTK